MRRILQVLAFLFFVVGVIWILQGLSVNIFPSSFMIGDPTWSVIGAICLAICVWLLELANRGRR